MWLRWTLPRPRIDQVLYTCVKVLFPAACVLFVAGSLWQLLVPSLQVKTIPQNPNPWVHYNPFSWTDWSRGGAAMSLVVQTLLALIGLALAGGLAMWVAYARFTARRVHKRLTDPEPIPEPA
jgi:hypothetical protein